MITKILKVDTWRYCHNSKCCRRIKKGEYYGYEPDSWRGNPTPHAYCLKCSCRIVLKQLNDTYKLAFKLLIKLQK